MCAAPLEKKLPLVAEHDAAPLLYNAGRGRAECESSVAKSSVRFVGQSTTPSSKQSLISTRDALLSQLCQALADRFGITPNYQMMMKLQRIYGDLESSKLQQRVIGLLSFPAAHPSWLELVAKLTVHETYFFRDEPQLNVLRQKLLPHLLKMAMCKPSPRLRILSAGCSTGEEAYSLSMLVLDSILEAGYAYGSAKSGITLLPGLQLEVLGVDVSTKALNKAQQANYTNEGLGSFRNMAPQWLYWFDRTSVEGSSDLDLGAYLNAKPQTHRRPKEYVRKVTRFEQHNLLEGGSHLGLFDMVICRNTMIYFNDVNKAIAQNHLFDLLKPEGILLLGATDPLQCPERCDQNRHHGMAYYTHKRDRIP